MAKIYNEKLKIKNEKLILPYIKEDRTSAWAQYSVRVIGESESSRNMRDKLIKTLSQTTDTITKIPTAIHYPMPLHLQECFKYLGYKQGDFPIAEKVSKEIMSLPMNPYLSDEEIKYIVKELINAQK